MYIVDQKRTNSYECLLEEEELIELVYVHVRYQWEAQDVYDIIVKKYEAFIKRIWK